MRVLQSHMVAFSLESCRYNSFDGIPLRMPIILPIIIQLFNGDGYIFTVDIPFLRFTGKRSVSNGIDQHDFLE